MNNDDRSLERAARMWIEAGPTEAPGRPVEAALLRIQTTPQERDLRIPWRSRPMFSNRLGLAAAAILMVAVGVFTFTRFDFVGHASPTATPSASPTAAPSRGAVDPLAPYANLPGWIVFEHFGQAPDGSTPQFDMNHRMIWLVRADGSGLHELAPNSPLEGKTSPDISPDGTKVAFASWGSTPHIYEIPIAGGEPVEFAGTCTQQFSYNGASPTTETWNGCLATDPTYSADGTRVAFVRSDPNAFHGFTGWTSVITILDLTSGVATPLESTRVYSGVTCGPSGEVETAPDPARVSDPTCGPDESTGYPSPTAFLSQPSWSPDSTRIVYTMNLKNFGDEHISDARLFVAKTTETVQPVSGQCTSSSAPKNSLLGPCPVELPRPSGQWAADADWSPDGSRIVFSTLPNSEVGGDGPAAHLDTVNPDGTNLVQLCNDCLQGGGVDPTWTPDGKHILFWAYASWALMNPDGTQMRHINPAKLTWYGGQLGYGYAAVLQPTP
jgi:Tol biopolymer transport system component